MSDPMEIPLTQGMVALVSPEDFQRVKALGKWHAMKCDNAWYAARHATRDKRRRTLFMHQFIADPPHGSEVDHWDRNGLNNQRYNLRVATRSQNLGNQRRFNSTGFKGVARNRSNFRAQIQFKGKRYYSSSVPTALEAAHDYDAMARKLFGGFALTNFTENGCPVLQDIVQTKAFETDQYFRRLASNNTSGFIGVRNRRGKFEARTGINGRIHVGTFSTDEEAARARDVKVLELYGPSADLNFKST
jgi:hypothetical protein